MVYLLPFLSIVLGYLITLAFPPKNKKVLKLLLAFSGAFLLTITVSHLLPEVYHHELEKISVEIHHHHHDHDHHHNHDHSGFDGMKKVGMFIMIGILFQIVLEFFSKGAEHGHVHIHEKLTNIPWLLFFSLCTHAFLEGMPLSNQHEMAWGIAIHHFPIAVILTTFFIQGGLSKANIFLFMIMFSLMTPLGTYLSNQLSVLQNYYTEISAIVVGILFHISSTIIFESSEGHKFNIAKISAIVFGIVLGFLI